jgi:hypothetical protein
MIQTGAELLVNRPGVRTATEAAGQAEGNKCDLQRIAETFEDALEQALDITAEMLGVDGPDVELFKQFGADGILAGTDALIKDLGLAGVISNETVIAELQRRGILSADIDPQDEAERVTAQGDALGTMSDPAIDDPALVADNAA